MLSKLLDEDTQKKIKDNLNSLFLPIKIYCIIITVLLLLNAFYLYCISKKLDN